MDAELDRTGQSRDGRSQRLSRGPVLRRKEARLALDPDGSVMSLESLSEDRLLFGRESIEFHKLQAGVKVRSPKPDWKLTVTPASVVLSGRLFETVEVTQKLEFCELGSTGFVRRVKLTNVGSAPMRLLMTSIHDPTTAHYRPANGKWGSVSVNAFNRTSHVAMDEVAEPPGARVVGYLTTPKSIYMTTDRTKAEEVVISGDSPDPTAGMSGQILIVALHEVELQPQATAELSNASLYNPSGLEDALADFRRAFEAKAPAHPRLQIECSVESLSQAMRWIPPALEGAEFQEYLLDRLESLPGLVFADPDRARKAIDSLVGELRRDGLLPHSSDARLPGHLESAALLEIAARFTALKADKKYARAVYRSLHKLAEAVRENKPASWTSYLPQGWRRALGKGCPSGTVPEVVAATSSALASYAWLAQQVGKSQESARFVESAEMSLDGLKRTAIDDRGIMALNIDRSGTSHFDETIDQAVALYRNPFDKKAASALVHRLQETDFMTDYGPRTVPTSNHVYFNGTYGDGQLGGFWTRAALSAAILAYVGGYPGLGSLQLQKVGRLVVDDASRLGHIPGTFPYWVDIERRASRGPGSDPVAASRLLEGVVRGELGFSAGGRGTRLAPPASSSLRWLMAAGLWLGEEVTVFVGRSESRVHTFASCSRLAVDDGLKFAKSEVLHPGAPGLAVCMFLGPGQVVCAGNTSQRPSRATINVAPKDPRMLSHLSVGLELLDHGKGSWRRVQTVRVSTSMALEISLDPGDWKALRFSTD